MHNPKLTKLILNHFKDICEALPEYSFTGSNVDGTLTPISDTFLFDKVEVVQDNDLTFIMQNMHHASKICLWELVDETPLGGRENTIKQKKSGVSVNTYILTLYPSKLSVNQEITLECEEILKYTFLEYSNIDLGLYRMDYTAVAHSSVPVAVNDNGEQTAYMSVIQWNIKTKRNYGG